MLLATTLSHMIPQHKSEYCWSARRSVRFKFRRVHAIRKTTSTDLVALDVTLSTSRARKGSRRRRALRTSMAHDRGGRRSSRLPGLHYARSSKFAIDRCSSSAARPHSQSPAADAQLLETHSTTITTSMSLSSMRSM